MNKVILMGRLVRDPDVKYGDVTVAKYTLAVDRRRNNGEENADFINCVTFRKPAEIAEKYLHKGTRVLVSGRIQTGNYINKDGQKVYTTNVIVEEQEFVDSKSSANANYSSVPNSGEYQAAQPPVPNMPYTSPADSEFVYVPDGMDDELPFH